MLEKILTFLVSITYIWLMWFYFPVYFTLQGIICQRTHDIYCSEAQPRSIFMCPRTNKPLQCTVDWEIKLLLHTQSCIPIGPELDVIIQGEIMPQIRHYIPVGIPRTVWQPPRQPCPYQVGQYRTIQGYISQLSTNRNRGFPLDVY